MRMQITISGGGHMDNDMLLGREFEVTIVNGPNGARAPLPSPKNVLEILGWLRKGYRLELAEKGVEPKRFGTIVPPAPARPPSVPPISGEREVSATFRVMTEDARPTVRPGVLKGRRTA